MYQFKFADIGEGLHEGKVAEIYKKVNDQVQEGQPLFSVETDKVTADIPSPVTGKVTKVLMEQGAIIHVGDLIYEFATDQKEAPLPPTTKVSEGGASVVGEVKVSNELFSLDKFRTNSTSVQNKSSPKNLANDSLSSPVFDISKIQAIGQGEMVDVVVIGAGPGGYTAGEFLAKANFKVVVVEKEFAGGVCLNVGCIPTKALLRSAKVLRYIKTAKEFGIDIDLKNVSLNWNLMLERKNHISASLRKGVESLIKAAKAQYIVGEAQIIDRYNVKVGDRLFTTKTIILATGSSPIILPLPGFEEAFKQGLMIDSTGALNLASIPKSITIVGGGVIGVEFGVLYKEMGSQVTIIEGADTILGPIDGEIKKWAFDFLKQSDINVITNAKVQGFDLAKSTLIYEQNQQMHEIKSDVVLLSIGRRPNNLGLDKTLGLAIGKRGEVIVNEHLQTSIDNIFAIGDIVGKSMLAHTAYKHAHVVVSIFKQHPTSWDMNKVPGCIFTNPEISVIGKTEEQLLEEKADYIKVIWHNKNVGKVLADGETFGFTKLLVDKKYGQILGAHIINTHSSDMIAEIATVIELEGTVYEIASTIHPHPSIGEVIYEAAVHAVLKLEESKRAH